MANYSYSTPYAGMSGGPLPPGFLQAATMSGQNIARGIEQAGAGIASAIAQYRQNKEQDQFVTAKVETLLAPYAQQGGGSNPETGLPLGLEKAVGIGGDKLIKKFVEGKASRMDKLALANALESYDQKRLDQQRIQLNQAQLEEIGHNKKQRDILSTLAAHPPIKMVEKEDELPEMTLGPNGEQIPTGNKVKLKRLVSQPMEGDAARAEIKRMVGEAGGDAKTIAEALALYDAGRTPEIGVKDLGQGISAVTQNGAVKDVVVAKPVEVDAKAQRELEERVIPGTNMAARTKEEAIKIRESVAQNIQSKGIISELLALSNIPGDSLNPKLRARGEVLARQLGAAIRTDILGPGAITDTERKILESIAANPATFWTWRLDDTARAALSTLEETLDSNLRSKIQSQGGVPLDGSEPPAASPAQPEKKFIFNFNPAKKKLVLEK